MYYYFDNMININDFNLINIKLGKTYILIFSFTTLLGMKHKML